MNKTLITAIILLLLGAGAYFIFGRDTITNIPVGTDGTAVTGGTNGNNGTVSTSTSSTTQTSMIRVSSPLPNATVSSPIAVSGEAKGNWYFEASFPIKVVDSNGRVLGQGIGQAQGDWMSTNFVPFRANINFSTSTTATGYLVLEKDNPSGLAQNAAEVRIPIRFNLTNTQTRAINLYFYNEANDKDANGNVLCSAKGLVAIPRIIPRTNTPIQDAVKELLKGPTAAEKSLAPNSEFPLAGVSLKSASLSNGILTLTIDDPQNRTSGGSCRVNILNAQITATAKQFGGVTRVRYSPNEVFQP